MSPAGVAGRSDAATVPADKERERRNTTEISGIPESDLGRRSTIMAERHGHP